MTRTEDAKTGIPEVPDLDTGLEDGPGATERRRWCARLEWWICSFPIALISDEPALAWTLPEPAPQSRRENLALRRSDVNEREVAAGLASTPGYRYVEVVGRELFIAGQVPHDAAGNVVTPGDAGRQAKQCLANLMTILNVHGFNTRDVRHLRIYVAGDEAARGEAWTGVREWFEDAVPPATLLGVNALGYRGQVVEIDARVVRE